ncbi:hypothetical protein [Clostridium porci]|uniref:Uncharacterized protein n=1 Tax=Clostridium porci TaxID=2605778 RepID=A0A7X2TF90_9CLOT|nr:hypothetical protein [Clostridium porci]MSS38681.1 hypothetical protein [Clostridium porci]
MTDEKIKISKDEADIIKKKIKEKYGSVENFIKCEGINSNDIMKIFKQRSVSVKLMCCFHEKLYLQNREEGLIIDDKESLRKLVKENDTLLENKRFYEVDSIYREITGNRVSNEMKKILNKVLEVPKTYGKDFSLSIRYAASPIFGTEDCNEKLFIILEKKMKKLSYAQLKFLTENIETFCLMFRRDWEFLYLMQSLDPHNLKRTKDFIEDITLNKSSTKSLQLMEMVDKYPDKNDKYPDKHNIERKKCISNIKNELTNFHDKPFKRFVTINLLICAIPYICYMDNCDWEMLSKFSLLEDWSNINDVFKRQKYVITFMRGLIYSKHMELVF